MPASSRWRASQAFSAILRHSQSFPVNRAPQPRAPQPRASTARLNLAPQPRAPQPRATTSHSTLASLPPRTTERTNKRTPRSLVRSFARSLVRSFVRSPVRPFARSPVRSFGCSGRQRGESGVRVVGGARGCGARLRRAIYWEGLRMPENT